MKRIIYFIITIILTFIFLTSPGIAQETCVIFEKGDTLYKIAKKYDVPVDILMKYNNITDATKIKVGVKINIPVVYKVKKGDTLYSIASEFGTSVDAIITLNSLSETKNLKTGQILIIPVSASGEKTVTKKDEASPLLWPHPGKREKLTGKLKGISIQGETGDTIVSVSSGKVIWAESYRGYGKMVLVKSNDNYIYIYAGNEKLYVSLGEDIRISTLIGTLGKSPHDGIPRVFFCVYRNNKPVDPYKAPRK